MSASQRLIQVTFFLSLWSYATVFPTYDQEHENSTHSEEFWKKNAKLVNEELVLRLFVSMPKKFDRVRQIVEYLIEKKNGISLGTWTVYKTAYESSHGGKSKRIDDFLSRTTNDWLNLLVKYAQHYDLGEGEHYTRSQLFEIAYKLEWYYVSEIFAHDRKRYSTFFKNFYAINLAMKRLASITDGGNQNKDQARERLAAITQELEQKRKQEHEGHVLSEKETKKKWQETIHRRRELAEQPINQHISFDDLHNKIRSIQEFFKKQGIFDSYFFDQVDEKYVASFAKKMDGQFIEAQKLLEAKKPYAARLILRLETLVEVYKATYLSLIPFTMTDKQLGLVSDKAVSIDDKDFFGILLHVLNASFEVIIERRASISSKHSADKIVDELKKRKRLPSFGITPSITGKARVAREAYALRVLILKHDLYQLMQEKKLMVISEESVAHALPAIAEFRRIFASYLDLTREMRHRDQADSRLSLDDLYKRALSTKDRIERFATHTLGLKATDRIADIIALDHNHTFKYHKFIILCVLRSVQLFVLEPLKQAITNREEFKKRRASGQQHGTSYERLEVERMFNQIERSPRGLPLLERLIGQYPTLPKKTKDFSRIVQGFLKTGALGDQDRAYLVSMSSYLRGVREYLEKEKGSIAYSLSASYTPFLRGTQKRISDQIAVIDRIEHIRQTINLELVKDTTQGMQSAETDISVRLVSFVDRILSLLEKIIRIDPNFIENIKDLVGSVSGRKESASRLATLFAKTSVMWRLLGDLSALLEELQRNPVLKSFSGAALMLFKHPTIKIRANAVYQALLTHKTANQTPRDVALWKQKQRSLLARVQHDLPPNQVRMWFNRLEKLEKMGTLDSDFKRMLNDLLTFYVTGIERVRAKKKVKSSPLSSKKRSWQDTVMFDDQPSKTPTGLIEKSTPFSLDGFKIIG